VVFVVINETKTVAVSLKSRDRLGTTQQQLTWDDIPREVWLPIRIDY